MPWKKAPTPISGRGCTSGSGDAGRRGRGCSVEDGAWDYTLPHRVGVQSDWGRIVMIASQAARTRTVVPGAHYQASKAGTVGFARVLAAKVAPHGITVNCVAPGRVESAMTAMVDIGTNGALANAIPAGRMGTPDEVAGAVAYFVSEQAAYSTGAMAQAGLAAQLPSTRSTRGRRRERSSSKACARAASHSGSSWLSGMCRAPSWHAAK